MSTSQADNFRIVIYGHGLAAELTTIALANTVGRSCQITRVEASEQRDEDLLFGGLTSPATYDFFRKLGITEPELILESQTAFSYGTKFVDWSTSGYSWLQSFQQPFPPLFGIPLYQYIHASKDQLESYLISAQAAIKGVFAHPPADPHHPLSRSEYGYHFIPDDIITLLSKISSAKYVERQTGMLVDHKIENGQIRSIRLDNGLNLSADLFIDCSGSARTLTSALHPKYKSEISLSISGCRADKMQSGAPYRILSRQPFGYELEIPLQRSVQRLRISMPDQNSEPETDGDSFTFDVGYLDQAWIGNCVCIGQSAAIFEPLSPAPMILLERSINYLLELIPNSEGMEVERREFIRRFKADCAHAEMFHHAMFVCDDSPKTQYWDVKNRIPVSAELQRKLRQFESRGLLVQYDFEPFHTEDWAILHYGVGRTPKRYDIQINGIPSVQIDKALEALRLPIEQTIATMPAHDVYIEKFKDYLKRNHYDRV